MVFFKIIYLKKVLLKHALGELENCVEDNLVHGMDFETTYAPMKFKKSLGAPLHNQ